MLLEGFSFQLKSFYEQEQVENLSTTAKRKAACSESFFVKTNSTDDSWYLIEERRCPLKLFF